MRTLKLTVGGIALGMVLAAASAANAVETLNFSFSSTGVGHCDLHTPTGCSPAHPAIYTNQGLQFGNNMNASSSASDPAWGVSHGSAGLGSGPLAGPQLHSDVTGVPTGPGVPYPWNYSQVQGLLGFKATTAFTLDLQDFVGDLDYSITGTGAGLVSASLAIITSAAALDPTISASYYTQDAAYGFANTCSASGALAIGETGQVSTKGTNLTATVTPTLCGASTINLAAGDSVFFWLRMQTFEAAAGTTDASNTFKLAFAPNLSADQVGVLSRELTPVGQGVPEPATWAMLVFGLGGVGGLMRARRRTFAPAA
jgi:hypothetical protein